MVVIVVPLVMCTDCKMSVGFREEEINLSAYDPHTVAGVLKSYLRELPEHVLTSSLAPEFEEAAARHGRSEKIKVM